MTSSSSTVHRIDDESAVSKCSLPSLIDPPARVGFSNRYDFARTAPITTCLGKYDLFGIDENEDISLLYRKTFRLPRKQQDYHQISTTCTSINDKELLVSEDPNKVNSNASKIKQSLKSAMMRKQISGSKLVRVKYEKVGSFFYNNIVAEVSKKFEENVCAKTEDDDKADFLHHNAGYFGSQGRREFLDRFAKIRSGIHHYPLDEDLPSDQHTPRTLFLREQDRRQQLPLPLILRKVEEAKAISLASMGLGDDRVLPLFQILESIPCIEKINVRDNRLTDDSLLLLTSKLLHLPSLKFLDMSFNKIDESSGAVLDYMKNGKSRLETLGLNGADVDDGECGNLMEAVIANKTIKSIGLSRNMIGKNEERRLVDRSVVTGGDAIAEMLSQNNTLTRLDLSWNAIRMLSAENIGRSMAVNASLLYLNLSYNNFGDLGTQLLGQSLKSNRCLRELDLSYNSLNPKSSIVLLNCLCHNSTIRDLKLDGNVLGRLGAQAATSLLHRCNAMRTAMLSLTFDKCDCRKVVPDLFDSGNPTGSWSVNLADPYGQMVADECFFLANNKVGCSLVSLEYNGKKIDLVKEDVSKGVHLSLEDFQNHCNIVSADILNGKMETASSALVSILDQFQLTMESEKRLELLGVVRTEWERKAKEMTSIDEANRDELADVLMFEIFNALFLVNYRDNSRLMNLSEFVETLESLGQCNLNVDLLARQMAELDIDRSGEIDSNEFSMIMVTNFCRQTRSRARIVSRQTGAPWVIPAEGEAVFNMSYEADLPTFNDTGEDAGVAAVVATILRAKNNEHKEVLFHHLVTSPYFFISLAQAQALLNAMHSVSRDVLHLIADILPVITTSVEVMHFIDQNLDDEQKLKLRIMMGPLYNVYVGCVTSHFYLDLSKPAHFSCSKRLSALSDYEAHMNRARGLNTSQRGFLSIFRNETYNGEVIMFTGDWFLRSSAVAGELRFDVVSSNRPPKGAKALSDTRFQRLIARLDLKSLAAMVKPPPEPRLLGLLDLVKKEGGSTLRLSKISGGSRKLSSTPMSTSPKSTRSNRSGLNSPLPPRAGTMNNVDGLVFEAEGRDGEKSPIPSLSGSSSFSPLSPLPRSRLWGTVTDLLPPVKVEDLSATAASDIRESVSCEEDMKDVPIPFLLVKESHREYMETSHHYLSVFPKERKTFNEKGMYIKTKDGDAFEEFVTPCELSYGVKPSTTEMHHSVPFGYYKLLQLQVLMPQIYLTVEQACEMMLMFPRDGYLRVQLLQSLFSRLIDLHNVHCIFNVLNEDERTEALHRLGHLNLFDPVYPDRQYKLDLRRWDHREMAKVLIALAVVEPGNNWVNQSFRWSRYDETVPGWCLPASWTTQDNTKPKVPGEKGEHDQESHGGPHTRGWLVITYTSTGEGCCADIQARKDLRKYFLCGVKRLL